MMNVGQTHVIPDISRLVNMAWTFDLNKQQAFVRPVISYLLQCALASQAASLTAKFVAPVLSVMSQCHEGQSASLSDAACAAWDMRWQRTDLYNPCTGCGGEPEGADTQLGHLVHSHIICDGANNDCNLVLL